MVSIENLESKLKKLVKSSDWKKLQEKFNKAKHIFLFGHGGNLGVADHGAIDMSRLTDKNVIAPGSGTLVTSIISDESFETWLSKWLELRTRCHRACCPSVYAEFQSISQHPRLMRQHSYYALLSLEL